MDGKAATSVTAHTARGSAQRTQGPLLAQALIDYGTALASFSFSADCHGGNHDQTTITGADGLIHCHGPDLNTQQVSIQRAGDTTTIPLDGHWFPDGFHGTMAELMRAIAADDIPSNNARDNLTSLALTYAAMASADRGEAVQPGTVRSVVL
jgi:predicted dehydrogenase